MGQRMKVLCSFVLACAFFLIPAITSANCPRGGDTYYCSTKTECDDVLSIYEDRGWTWVSDDCLAIGGTLLVCCSYISTTDPCSNNNDACCKTQDPCCGSCDPCCEASKGGKSAPGGVGGNP
jgi:hypothetical protein